MSINGVVRFMRLSYHIIYKFGGVMTEALLEVPTAEMDGTTGSVLAVGALSITEGEPALLSCPVDGICRGPSNCLSEGVCIKQITTPIPSGSEQI